MPPLLASYRLEHVEVAFRGIGIYLLEAFPDGQARWGDAPMGKPYQGRSVMTAPYVSLSGNESRYDIFAIRNAVTRLGKSERLPEAEVELEKHIFEEPAHKG